MIHWSFLSTSQRIKAIKDIWQEGMSADQISKALLNRHGYVSKGAVVGMFTRHRDKMGEVSLRPANGRTGKATSAPAQRKRRKKRPVPTEAPEPLNLTLMDLTARTCRWPVNDGSPFLFCGAEADDPLSPYCPFHADLGVGIGTESERRASRLKGGGSVKNDCLDAATTELDALGVPYDIDWTSKHVHIRYGENREHLHVVAKTPSDCRAHKNERAAIRRDLKRQGYLQSDEPAIIDEPLIIVRDHEARCTSIDVAKNFDKAHKDVLRAIDGCRENCGEEFDQRNFAPIEYRDGKGRTYRAYEMSRDGFSLVVMGFTGKAAMRWKVAYISAFDRMAAALQSQPPADEIEQLRADLNAALDLMASIEKAPPAPEPKSRGTIPPRMVARQMARRQARRA
ncbi:Rha family transcriptional regulator [Pseudohoeflea coraliihabitans]|uniref:Rha family transcriptional regulator n=1 Tax=Pseudohoeflea coraliihabitans TaxID=2860393 RepID=A0ABS6WLJ5_9HYPH|nr:Rha family transcriptional regulator [Pseudohoeflea sp. DP4N28-3]MBW3096831.1 Rha family transcriptional regulator [Pseudohoeflea sp. DP4N28-3]